MKPAIKLASRPAIAKPRPAFDRKAAAIAVKARHCRMVPSWKGRKS